MPTRHPRNIRKNTRSDSSPLFEGILKRLLKESQLQKASGLALNVYAPFNNRISAVIYDPAALAEVLDTITNPKVDSLTYKNILVDKVIKGVIRLAASSQPCNDAWEVTTSAGPGYGKLIYGVGFALAPNGRLMPDRMSVSSSASAGWARQFNSPRKKFKLDNYEDPQTIPPEDDCPVHNETDDDDSLAHLDYAYEAEGWELSLLNQLQSSHDTFTSNLTSDQLKLINSRLPEAITPFFNKYYNS